MILETIHYMVKCRFGDPLRKTLNARKVTKTQPKNVAHNSQRIEYLEILNIIAPH